MNKKGDIWISAVLYFGLGIIIITILLAAGLPVINKLKDKNIAIQTKEVFQTLDQNIREVLKGGPGTQRVVTLNIKKGQFTVNNEGTTDANTIVWEYDSKAYISEPNERVTTNYLTEWGGAIKIKDGNVNVATFKTATKGVYHIIYKLEYSPVTVPLAAINMGAGNPIKVSGIGDVSIRNGGPVDPTGTSDDKRIKLSVSETGRAGTA